MLKRLDTHLLEAVTRATHKLQVLGYDEHIPFTIAQIVTKSAIYSIPTLLFLASLPELFTGQIDVIVAGMLPLAGAMIFRAYLSTPGEIRHIAGIEQATMKAICSCARNREEFDGLSKRLIGLLFAHICFAVCLLANVIVGPFFVYATLSIFGVHLTADYFKAVTPLHPNEVARRRAEREVRHLTPARIRA